VFLSTSFVIIEQDKIGHLKRVLFAADMPPAQTHYVRRTEGTTSGHSRPGFHLIALVNILFEVEQFPVVEIPKGSYGLLTAKDGAPLGSGEYTALNVKADEVAVIKSNVQERTDSPLPKKQHVWYRPHPARRCRLR